MRSYFTAQTLSSILTIYSRRRQTSRPWPLSVSLLIAEREAVAMATKRQSAEYREKEAVAKATKCQSAE